MASLKVIRTRIQSVTSTKKITRAMKLVATAKLRKSQEAIVNQRPYALHIKDTVDDIATRTDKHPLLEQRETINNECIIVLTSDRGLAGGFNSTLCRKTEQIIADGKTKTLWVVGNKGMLHFSSRDISFVSIDQAPTIDTAKKIAQELAARIIEDFKTKTFDRITIVYNKFKSVVTQTVEHEQILPVTPTHSNQQNTSVDFLYEPSEYDLLSHLVPLHIETQCYRYLLESLASELGARMNAMDSATRNADEMIDKLTLEYNRARQAAITTELLEIISGAEALKA